MFKIQKEIGPLSREEENSSIPEWKMRSDWLTTNIRWESLGTHGEKQLKLRKQHCWLCQEVLAAPSGPGWCLLARLPVLVLALTLPQRLATSRDWSIGVFVPPLAWGRSWVLVVLKQFISFFLPYWLCLVLCALCVSVCAPTCVGVPGGTCICLHTPKSLD